MSEDNYLHLQAGTVVNNRYEIVKCLGTGSMGMVYACRHQDLPGHIVAMKVLFSEVARDEVAAARFRNEIVASYKVNHPNVARAYEYFRDGDLVAFTMEHVDGGDLADRIASDQELDIDEIIQILSQICSGVRSIHEAGIIHRDLKPENILLTKGGDVKITDFGIARTGTGPKLTEYGGVVGTIDYVSPEYLEKGHVDHRSDIYAMGILAYEMVTGESPFKGKSVIETMTLRLRTDPESPHDIRRDCPEGLSRIILKAMARDAEARYQSAEEMYAELENLAREYAGGSARSKPESALVASSGGEEDFEESDPVLEQLRGAGLSSRQRKEQEEQQAPPQTASQDLPQEPHLEVDASQQLDATVSLTPEAVESVKSAIVKPPATDSLSKSLPQLQSNQESFALEPTDSSGISVSQSGLSVQRIQELNWDLYSERESSIWTFVRWLTCIAIGVGIALFGFQRYAPGYFKSQKSEIFTYKE